MDHTLIIDFGVLRQAVREVGIGPIMETKLRSGALALTHIAIDDEADSYALILRLARIYRERGKDGDALALELAHHMGIEWDGGVPSLRFLNVRLEH